MRATASLLLLRRPADPEVYWVRRHDEDRFLSGFMVFPGGAVDAGDGEGDAALRRAAVRETFEETGYLHAEGAAPTADERAAVRSGQVDFAAWCTATGRAPRLDALTPAGAWTAPAYLVSRFRTYFFTTWVADDAAPRVDAGDPELTSGGWVRPADALAAWERGEVLLAPPTRALLQALADGAARAPERFGAADVGQAALAGRSPVRPWLTLFPVRTPTLPPATHTNCYLVGDAAFVVVDPASPDAAERARLDAEIDARVAAGDRLEAIVLTHHHHDHVGGVAHLAGRTGAPVWAHVDTARRVKVPVARHLEDGEVLPLGARRVEVLHTPGHAPGHVCLLDLECGAAVVGDMVAGVGTILVEPGDGDMAQYLTQLERLADRAPAVLLPAHGPAIGGAVSRLRAYVAHRLMREGKVLAALEPGPVDVPTLVERAYADAPPIARQGPGGGIAGLSVRAHLIKLTAEGRAVEQSPGRWARISAS